MCAQFLSKKCVRNFFLRNVYAIQKKIVRRRRRKATPRNCRFKNGHHFFSSILVSLVFNPMNPDMKKFSNFNPELKPEVLKIFLILCIFVMLSFLKKSK